MGDEWVVGEDVSFRISSAAEPLHSPLANQTASQVVDYDMQRIVIETRQQHKPVIFRSSGEAW